MTWFEALTGFPERSPKEVRENIVLDDETLTSRANGRKMVCGRLETSSLAELRERTHPAGRRGHYGRVRPPRVAGLLLGASARLFPLLVRGVGGLRASGTGGCV